MIITLPPKQVITSWGRKILQDEWILVWDSKKKGFAWIVNDGYYSDISRFYSLPRVIFGNGAII